MRRTLSIIGVSLLLVLGTSCGPEDPIPPEPSGPTAVLTLPDQTYLAKDLFFQDKTVVNALALEPRSSDGMLMFSFSTDYSSTSFRYAAPPLENEVPSLAVSTGTVPAGTNQTTFHMELPMSIVASVPEEMLDVESVTLWGPQVISFTLDPDFPFTKARVRDATITLPAWVKETYPSYIIDHKAAWRFGETVYPGQLEIWDIYSSNIHTLEAGEGIRESDHRLCLDGTILIDGTLVVDENDRKRQDESGSPWEGTFLFQWDPEAVQIGALKGCMDLSRKLDDGSITFSRIPSFLKASGTVFDLEDLYGEVKIKNGSPAPVSVSGVIQSDEREYGFGEGFGLAPVVAPRNNEPYHALLSEKGGRVPFEQEDYYCDVPFSGFSRAIDTDPVSFGLKDLRIQNDTDTPYSFVFDEDNRVSIQALISSPLLVGENFQTVHRIPFETIPGAVGTVERVKGSLMAENTFPFDYEVIPVLYDQNWMEIEVRTEPLRIPAGTQLSPEVAPLSFDWTLNGAAPRYMELQLIGRTAKNRQGEPLYQTQHLTLKDVTVEFY